MKQLIYIIFIGFIFSNTIYLGADISGWYDGEAYDYSEDFDDLGILIGYDYNIKKYTSYEISIGASYMLQSLYRETWMDAWSGIIYGGQEAEFISIYTAPKIFINDKIGMWVKIGTNLQTEYYFDKSIGLTYGFGFNYRTKNKLIGSLGFVSNNTSLDNSIVNIYRINLSLGYDLE